MKEKSGPGKIEEQINQLHNNLDQMSIALKDLNGAMVAACTPEDKGCEIAPPLDPTPSSDAPLVGALRDVNERIISLMRCVININERLEL